MQNADVKVEKHPNLSRRKIIGLSILLFFLLAITGTIGYWNANKHAIIKNKLETAVTEKTGGLYKIKYDSLDIDEIAGYLSISNMELLYDSSRYDTLTLQGNEPPLILQIHIPEISASGIKTPKALIGKEIVGRKLEIKNPVIHIMYTRSVDSSRTLLPNAIYEQLLGNLDLIQADTLLISGAQITTSDFKTKKIRMQWQDVNITMVNVKVDSSSSTDSSRIFFAKELDLNSRKIDWTSADKLYNFSAADLSVSSLSRYLRITSFSMSPTLGEEAFVKSLPAQGDRFDLSFSNIEMKNIDLQQLLEEKIVADNILLPGASLKIYRDRAIPRDTKDRIGEYPHQLLQTIPIPILVKRIVVSNGYIEYKEKHPISRQAGKIQYYKVNASISNFTNDKKAIAANSLMTVDMSSMFLDKAPMKVTGRFYLLHPKGRFDLDGTFGSMDATLLNPVTEPTGMTRIRSGKINGVEFSIKGEDRVANGTVKLLYDDLKVNALEKDKGATELDSKALASFMANIAIKNSNPTGKQDVRIAQVHLNRNTNTSLFNFAWKIVLKGMMETVGL